MKIWIFIILLFFTLLIASGNSTADISSTATASTIGKKGREYAVLIGGISTGILVTSVETWFPGKTSPCTVPPTIPDIPQGVFGLSAAVLGNRIIYCGGWSLIDFELNIVKQCYTYTVGSSRVSWDPAPSMIHGRMGFTLTGFTNILIATGGQGSSDSSVELYIGGRWIEMIDWKLTTARINHCAVKYGDSKLVLTGGRTTRALVEKLDTTTGGWTQMPSMNYGRQAHSCVSFKDDIIVAGGYYYDGINNMPIFDTAERFSSATGNWEILPRLNIGRAYHSMAVLNGYPYIMGVYDGSYKASTEYWNGTQWLNGKQLLNKRSDHGAVVLACD